MGAFDEIESTMLWDELNSIELGAISSCDLLSGLNFKLEFVVLIEGHSRELDVAKVSESAFTDPKDWLIDLFREVYLVGNDARRLDVVENNEVMVFYKENKHIVNDLG